MIKTLRVHLVVALLGLAALTGCAAPTVTTEVTVASQLSMTPDINPTLHAMPDWGDKIAVIPAKNKSGKDPIFLQIKTGLESMLNLAHMDVVSKGQGERRAHHLYRHERRSAFCYTGVGYCLFVFGLTRASRQINERLHTFLFLLDYHTSGARVYPKLSLTMKKCFMLAAMLLSGITA